MNDRLLCAVLEGHPLPHDGPYCGSCFHQFSAGANVVVVTRRPYGVDTWEINSLYCLDCAPASVPETLHGSSAMATADIASLVDTARQEQRPALCNVTIEETVFVRPGMVSA